MAGLRDALLPSTSRAPDPMRAIDEAREETSNPVLPYACLRDAKVGQV